MKIEIIDRFTSDGKSYLEWWLWTGPDGIDHVHGYATDLITAFSKIMEWRERIDADYAQEFQKDLNTLENWINTENETLSH